MSDNNGRLSPEQHKELYRSVKSGLNNTRSAQAVKSGGGLNDVPSFMPKHRREDFIKQAPVQERTNAEKQTEQSAPLKPQKAHGSAAQGLLAKLLTKPACPDAPLAECRWFAKRGRFDMPLFTVTMVLLVFGLVMMSSASYAYSLKEQSDSTVYMIQQMWGAVMGLIAMMFVSKLDYHAYIRPWKKTVKAGKGTKKSTAATGNANGINFAKIAFAASLGLMVMVLFFGDSVNDAKRWITIAGLQFQPSELLKISAIVLVAYMLQRYYPVRKNIWYGFGKYWLVLIPACALCILQRHVSATLIIFAIIFAMMFVGGCNTGGMWASVIFVVIGALMLLYVFKWEYLTDRIISWQQPFSDMQDGTFQTSQSLITIGSGGWGGLGLGNSRQKYYYLPESQNDFVFSIICEELGFIGGVTVILLFVLFEIRGFSIAAKAKDKFGSFIALGITIQIGLQAMLNIGVACNAIPNTGISLPFFSYGRTALIIQLVEVGVLMSVSREADT